MQIRPCALGVHSGQTGVGLPGRRPFLPGSLALYPTSRSPAMVRMSRKDFNPAKKRCDTCNRYHTQGAPHRSGKVPFLFRRVPLAGLWDTVKIRKSIPWVEVGMNWCSGREGMLCMFVRWCGGPAHYGLNGHSSATRHVGLIFGPTCRVGPKLSQFGPAVSSGYSEEF